MCVCLCMNASLYNFVNVCACAWMCMRAQKRVCTWEKSVLFDVVFLSV